MAGSDRDDGSPVKRERVYAPPRLTFTTKLQARVIMAMQSSTRKVLLLSHLNVLRQRKGACPIPRRLLPARRRHSASERELLA